MLDTILITVLIVAICIALLSIGIFLKGKFPNTHVSGNKALRKKGVGCVQSQDREARKPNKNDHKPKLKSKTKRIIINKQYVKKIMKRTNFILNGFLALAIVLVFAQCSDNNNAATSSTAPAVGVAGSSNMKIAYVEIDSLLTKYNFWNDLNEVMIQKEENIRTTLNEKAKKLDADAKEFQRKLENNGFATRERAEQEQMRLMKQQQELQALQQKLSDELASENQKNSLQLRDSINSFLKIYNQNKDMI